MRVVVFCGDMKITDRSASVRVGFPPQRRHDSVDEDEYYEGEEHRVPNILQEVEDVVELGVSGPCGKIVALPPEEIKRVVECYVYDAHDEDRDHKGYEGACEASLIALKALKFEIEVKEDP